MRNDHDRIYVATNQKGTYDSIEVQLFEVDDVIKTSSGLQCSLVQNEKEPKTFKLSHESLLIGEGLKILLEREWTVFKI